MATLAQLVVKVGADTKAFTQGMAKVSKETQDFRNKMDGIGSKMQNFGKTMTAGVTVPLVAAGAAGFKMAADLQDAMGATDQIFKGSSNEMKKWADGLESYYGIAEGQALEYGNMMGSMLQNIGGLTEAEAAKQSQTLIKLAGDLTAMFGGTTESAVQALTGALKGNNTMLDNYGMAVNDAMIKTKALEMGLYTGTGQMDLATKQAATLALIMEQSGAAQGQAAREAEGASGSMRALVTELKNLATSFGEVLLPVITPFIAKLNDLVKGFSGMSPQMQKTVVAVAAVAAAVGPLIMILGSLASGISAVIGIAPVLGAAFTIMTGPVGLVIAAIAALIAIGVLLYKNWDTIKYYGLQAWGGLKIGVMKAIDAIAGAYERLYGWVPVLGSKIKSVHAQIRKSIEEEQNLLSNRVQGSGTNGMADFRQLDNNSVASQVSTIGIVPELEALSGIGVGGSGGVAGAAVKAAEDTRAAWEKTADLLEVKLQVLTTQYDTLAASTKMSGDKTIEFALKNNALNEQMQTQRAIVDAVNEGYIRGLNNTELTIEEKEKLRLRLEQEKKALADLELQQYENIQAQQAMATALKALSDRVKEVAETYQNDMAAALEEYKQKCAEVNAKLIADEKNVTAEFEKTVAQRAKALSNFVGLFEAVNAKDVSGSTLLSNLKGQVETFSQWQNNINALGAKGIDEGLMAELRSMGPSAAAEIAALNTLSAPELAEYVNLWQQKSNMARVSAEAELETQRMETVAKIAQLREDAAIQLEAYKVEWEKKNEEIRKNTLKELETIAKEFEDITGKSYSQGAALVLNFAEGMESEFTTLQSTIDTMYGIVGAGTPSVKVQSPSNVVPINGSTVTNNSISINVTGANAREIWEELGPEIERKLVLAGV